MENKKIKTKLQAILENVTYLKEFEKKDIEEQEESACDMGEELETLEKDISNLIKQIK